MGSSGAEAIQKTKQALEMLKNLGCEEELTRVLDSKKIRAGKGKMRNRRYVMRRGPLVVYNEDNGIVRAIRNIPGVETACVDRLNLLQLAPGGNFGRFIIWTEGAFKKYRRSTVRSRAALLRRKAIAYQGQPWKTLTSHVSSTAMRSSRCSGQSRRHPRGIWRRRTHSRT